jgi:PAS domain S-box-containing protein
MARSLKTNYLLLALGVGTVLSLLLGGVSYYEHRVDTADINQLTHAAVEQKLEADLEARADSLSKITGALLAPALSSGNKAAVSTIAERLLEERDIERVEVRDTRGGVLFTGSNQLGDPSGLGPFVLKSSIRGKGAGSSQSAGTLQIWLNRAEMHDTLASIQSQMENRQGRQIERMSGLLAKVAVPLILLGLLGAWYIARQLARPITALVKSADRIGEGDYTRPLAVMRRDELGELQYSLERMRQNLAETTITKNYLNTVLNSLSDAVLVTSPDGIVKSCNEATQKLLGYSEAELVGKPLTSFIDDAHRNAFDPALSTTEARETVLRTANGQYLRRPQHHGAQACGAPDPLPGAIRHADEDAESHAISAFAAAGDRAHAPQSAFARAALSGLG